MKGRPGVTHCIPDSSLSVSSLLKQHCGPESEMLGREFGAANDGPPVEVSHCIKVKLCGLHSECGEIPLSRILEKFFFLYLAMSG